MLNKKENDLLSALGHRIKKARIAKGFSQKQLSYSSKMEKSSISRIENGKINISIYTLARLSKCLDVGISEMIPD